MKRTHQSRFTLFHYTTTFLTLLLAIALNSCKPQEALLKNSLKKTHEAVTPVIQTASWAENWWMDRHNNIVKRNKTEETDLIFIGNSIIHHWEDTGADSWNHFFSKYNPVNMGFGGDQTQHVLWRLENGELDHINPGLAVILIGTNNASAGHIAGNDCRWCNKNSFNSQGKVA